MQDKRRPSELEGCNLSKMTRRPVTPTMTPPRSESDIASISSSTFTVRLSLSVSYCVIFSMKAFRRWAKVRGIGFVTPFDATWARWLQCWRKKRNWWTWRTTPSDTPLCTGLPNGAASIVLSCWSNPTGRTSTTRPAAGTRLFTWPSSTHTAPSLCYSSISVHYPHSQILCLVNNRAFAGASQEMRDNSGKAPRQYERDEQQMRMSRAGDWVRALRAGSLNAVQPSKLASPSSPLSFLTTPLRRSFKPKVRRQRFLPPPSSPDHRRRRRSFDLDSYDITPPARKSTGNY